MLGKVVTELQRDWDTMVPGVMLAYRATVHATTGYSRNFLVFDGSPSAYRLGIGKTRACQVY